MPGSFNSWLIASCDLLIDAIKTQIATLLSLYVFADIKLLTEVTNEGTCVITRHAECPCLFGDQFIKDRPFYFKIIREIRQVDLEVSQMPEFIKSDVFTVLLQTFTEAVAFPKTADDKTDNSLFAPDCFHFSQKGHAWGKYIHTFRYFSVCQFFFDFFCNSRWPTEFLSRVWQSIDHVWKTINVWQNDSQMYMASSQSIFSIILAAKS